MVLTIEEEQQFDYSLFKTFFEQLGLALLVLHYQDLENPEFIRLIYANETASKLTGYDMSSVVGSYFRDSFPEVLKTELPSRYREAIINNEIVYVGNITYGDKNIKKAIFTVTAVPLGGQYVGIAFENLGSRKAYKGLLENANVLRLCTIGEMATNMAHELNQPLAAIASLAQGCVLRLRSNIENPNIEEQIEALHKMTEYTHYAANIIRRTKSVSEKRKIIKEPVNLEEVISAAVELLYRAIKKRNINLKHNSLNHAVMIYADRVLLKQVFVNVMRNAIDALQESDVSPRILVIETLVVNQQVSIYIKDNGIGFEKADQYKLFDTYYTTKKEGLGVGLSICRTIIERHGGAIRLTTAEQGFTVCQINLPLHNPEVD